MTNDVIRIAMWAGPRNISTTMMRAFQARADTSVADEPFYAYYLKESGAQHPMRSEILDALPQSWRGVVSQLNGAAPDNAPIYFHKHIAYHFAAAETLPLDWIDEQRTFILIRDPRAMVASYAKKYDDVEPIIKSLDVQRRVFARVVENNGRCPVVDATDVLRNPESMLRRLCEALDVPFTDEMLTWPEGQLPGDGIWAPHWYPEVMKSSGFRPFVEKPITLDSELEALAARCAPAYHALHEHRLTA